MSEREPANPSSATGRFLQGLGQDLRYGLRSLVKSPGFALVAIATLALGIGANTATFSVVHGVLLKRLPYAEPERLMAVWEVNDRGGTMRSAWANFQDWRERSRSFESLASYYHASMPVLGADRTLLARAAGVSEDFFRVLGVTAARGRTPAANEHRPGGEAVAVVSHAFWRDALGGDPGLDHRLELHGESYQVVGVLPEGFAFPDDTAIWVPLEPSEPSLHRTAHNYYAVGRLAPGADAAAAERELTAIIEEITAGEVDEYLPVGARVRSLQEDIAGPVERPLWILLGAAGFVLLVACTNLASTFLARGTGRRREMAVRRSLGASRWRLLRQLFTESLGLALAGAAAGLVVGSLLLEALALLAPAALPRLDEVRLDPAVLAFTLALSVLTAVLFGLLPGLRLARAPAAADLRSGGRGVDPGQRRAWSLLVAVEVALAIVLLAGSGLLVRSFWGLLSVELGFAPREVLTAEVHLPATRYAEDPQLVAYYDDLLAGLAAAPAVAGAGVTSALPLAGFGAHGRIEVTGGPEPTANAGYRLIGGDYFAALGIPLLRGRLFTARDRGGAPDVALVNQTLAEQAWPGEDPLGKQLTGGGLDAYWEQERWATVVGVVGDVRHRSLAEGARPEVYFPLAQRPGKAQSAVVVVKAEAGAAGVAAGGLRRALAASDPEVPVELGTMDGVIASSLAERRFALLLLGAFAAVALALAAVGIYGVVSYGVARRRREMGIRLALGAVPGELRGMVVRQSMAAVAAGIAAGVAGAAALSRLLAGLLYEVEPGDPATFAAVAALLAAAALAASWLPARRAARIAPRESLGAE